MQRRMRQPIEIEVLVERMSLCVRVQGGSMKVSTVGNERFMKVFAPVCMDHGERCQ